MARTCTLKGNPLTRAGNALNVGDTAPDATLKKDLATAVKLSELGGNARILSVVPSLDTPVCHEETKKFNEQAGQLPNVEILVVSMDLPFGQKRWCGAAGIDKIQVISDHASMSFGEAYGALIKELRLLARAIFVVDAQDAVRYVEIVPEVTSEPNYEAALKAAKEASC